MSLFDEPKYFSEDELRSSSYCLSFESELLKTIQEDPFSLFDWPTLRKLDQTREFAGIPFKITCSFRSRAYDLTQGRSGNSAHTKGRAFDIKATSNRQRFKILQAAILCGWTRIGIGKNFIHLDNDPTLPQQVVWHYY